MAQFRTMIGLMSGTSMDGVDVALIRTDGTAIESLGPFRTYPYSQADRETVEAALQAARTVENRDDRPPPLAAAESLITTRHHEAVEQFLADFAIDRSGIDGVGFHGQTVFHDPARALTVQIGDGDRLADRLGIPVVWDMRADDMAAGGQGAPLAPVFHRALAVLSDLPGPVVFLNIGGVANLTWIGPHGELLAFDCGPGNALLDDWIRLNSDDLYDRDGLIARSGREPDGAHLETLLADAYFRVAPPKSLDRDHFSVPRLADLSLADGASLLTHFSARAIARSAAFLPVAPEIWIATGGGRRNRFMMELIETAIEGPLMTAERLGFDGDAIEAQAFGFLAVRQMCGLPLTYPGTTGVNEALSGGRLSLPGS